MLADTYPKARERPALPRPPASEPPWITDAVAGQRYGSGSSSNGGVGNYPQIQLFNPAGSARCVLLERFAYKAASADTVQGYLRRGSIGTFDFRGVNLKSGQGLSAAEVWLLNDTSLIGGDIVYGDQRIADTWISVPEVGVILRPGYGFHLDLAATNTLLLVQFFWRERPGV